MGDCDASEGHRGTIKQVLKLGEEELGVVFARSQHTGALMVPRSYAEFECVQTKSKERRKVAKIIS